MKEIDIENVEISPRATAMVPAAVANVYRIVPVSFDDGVLTVAVADPWNLKAVEDLSRMFGCRVRTMGADEEAVMRVIRRVYGGPGKTVEDLFHELDGPGSGPGDGPTS